MFFLHVQQEIKGGNRSQELKVKTSSTLFYFQTDPPNPQPPSHPPQLEKGGGGRGLMTHRHGLWSPAQLYFCLIFWRGSEK